MTHPNELPPRSQANFHALITGWCLKIALFGVLLVLFTTLYPFNFSLGEGRLVHQVVQSFSSRTSKFDLLANVVLFLPLGFGAAGLLSKTRLTSIAQLVATLLMSVGLSVGVELLQVFLPARAATYTDIITNGLGGLLGGFCFQWQGVQLLNIASAITQRVKRLLYKLSIQQLTAAFLVYLLLAFGTAIALQTGTLSNWNSDFSLRLGNNQEGTAPAWEGSISEVLIADRSVSQQEATQILAGQATSVFKPASIVANYQLQSGDRFPDRAGVSPDLIGRGQSPVNASSGTGAVLTTKQWLETESATTQMIQRLRNRSEFTLSTTVTPATTNIDYFARFLSISGAPKDYNFMMGQIGQLMLFWLRTSHNAGSNGTPNGFMGGIFTAGQPCHLVFTYSGSFARLYTDATSTAYTFDLTSINYKVLSLGIIFAPLGFLLALIAARLRGRLLFYILLIFSGALLPPCLLEGMLSIQAGRSISRSNLLLGMLIIISALLLFRDRAISFKFSLKGDKV